MHLTTPLLLALAAATTPPASALPFAFSNTLGDYAVVQLPVVVWGTGAPGAKVSVTVAASPSRRASPSSLAPRAVPAVTATVGADGIWRAPLALIEQGLTPVSISAAASSGKTLTIRDVLVGKVMLCAGQSNIELVSVSKAFNATAELAACGSFPGVRIARTTNTNAWSGPLVDLPTMQQPWAVPSPTNCAAFSATCWFAARDLSLALGGNTPVGVVQSAVGGTAVRNWVPTRALASCSQPWSDPHHYGYHPYTHSTLYNGMVAPFGTGPTTFSLVLWDQAESDSYPQTLPGYYGCQTLAHVNSWRALLQDATLPWIFVHLQPYTGSESGASPSQVAAGALWGDPLAELRHAQLAALQLGHVGYASAMDLGDSTSPYGNVHFQNKQVISARIVDVALAVAFVGNAANAADSSYPAPAFLSQRPGKAGGGCAMTVAFFRPTKETGTSSWKLAMGTTPDPGTNGTSAVCPTHVQPQPTASPPVNASYCGGYELLCTPYGAFAPSTWVPAMATLSADGRSLSMVAKAQGTRKNGANETQLVARGSRYAWSAWPLASLFTVGGNVKLPVLPWSQGLTCTNGAVPGSPC